ncbi:hypothetical protein [Burkholderia gladioli]|uniref:beta-sandwich lipoprotein n=1 Tax=Burkholderia gladioli TaxID=28095 RepID=UPI0026551137|nr:hypothetical protein [Burkholderia gladioli]MDN7724885.1 hypothetical protein [Burkholderia gladioli]
MNHIARKSAGAMLGAAILVSVAGCNDADVASRNLSTAADNFEINRRVVFYNGITGDYILTIEGLCSKGNDDTAAKLTITCKVGPGQYKKHYLGLSDNVTYFMEQIDAAPADVYHYKVVFKPSVIVPDISVK